MSILIESFNNREIAVGIWVILAASISVFTKPVRQFIKSVLPILFCFKFIIFYIVFLSYFGLVIFGLKTIGFWDTSLLKDTILWVFFYDLPLFVKTIEKAKDKYFFTKLIKENIALITIIEFILNFWTFELITEIIIVPVFVLIGVLYAISSGDKKYQKVKRLFEFIFIIFGFFILINTAEHLIRTPKDIINIEALKEFLLPILLLILNIPLIYGLALYNTYEQVFIRVKGSGLQKWKIKWKIFRFSGFYLSKITAVLNNSAQNIMISLTASDMQVDLNRLSNRLAIQVGENYMKRTRFYIIMYVIGMFICIIGLILSNSDVSLKDILAFNFTLDNSRIKEIFTYICSSGIVVLFCFFVYSIGLGKKKYEEISQVKKYSLYNFTYLIKRQYYLLQEFPPIDAPKELYIQYITLIYELKSECDKAAEMFENLLTTWELNLIKQLQLTTTILVNCIGIPENEINHYTPDSFSTYFMIKKSKAPQSEKINVFIHEVQKGLESYSEQIKLCYDEFKHYM